MFCSGAADSLILEFDTFGTTNVNGGRFHFNWKSKKPGGCLFHEALFCSGGRVNDGSDVYEGHFECRSSTKRRMDTLRDRGQFVTPWKGADHLFLMHYMDNRGSSQSDYEDRKAISTARVAMLPEYVRKAIGR